MNLIPAKMLKAYRANTIDVTDSWANLSAKQVIDAERIGAKFEDVITNYEAADASLETAINTAVNNINTDNTSLEAAIDAEEDRAAAAELSLDTEIDNEEARALAAEALLQAAIQNEVNSRVNAQASIDAYQTVQDEETESLITSVASTITTNNSALTTAVSSIEGTIAGLDADGVIYEDDYFVEVNDFANHTLVVAGAVGTQSFTLNIADTPVAGTVLVFINGIEVHAAEANYSTGIVVPFTIEGDDTITVKYVKAGV